VSATHAFHDALPGFDPAQILHDGCGECERRSRDVALALDYMDMPTFARAWRRAFDHWASEGNGTGELSSAEQPLLHALWVLQVIFSRHGVPLTGKPPGWWPPLGEFDG